MHARLSLTKEQLQYFAQALLKGHEQVQEEIAQLNARLEELQAIVDAGRELAGVMAELRRGDLVVLRGPASDSADPSEVLTSQDKGLIRQVLHSAGLSLKTQERPDEAEPYLHLARKIGAHGQRLPSLLEPASDEATSVPDSPPQGS